MTTVWLTWKDLMKVHSRLRIPSERFSNLTRRMTRKSRKNVMETEAFSDAYGQKEPEKKTEDLMKRKHKEKKKKHCWFSTWESSGLPQWLA